MKASDFYSLNNDRQERISKVSDNWTTKASKALEGVRISHLRPITEQELTTLGWSKADPTYVFVLENEARIFSATDDELNGAGALVDLNGNLITNTHLYSGQKIIGASYIMRSIQSQLGWESRGLQLSLEAGKEIVFSSYTLSQAGAAYLLYPGNYEIFPICA
jgi:hypothetical protein